MSNPQAGFRKYWWIGLAAIAVATLSWQGPTMVQYLISHTGLGRLEVIAPTMYLSSDSGDGLMAVFNLSAIAGKAHTVNWHLTLLAENGQTIREFTGAVIPAGGIRWYGFDNRDQKVAVGTHCRAHLSLYESNQDQQAMEIEFETGLEVMERDGRFVINNLPVEFQSDRPSEPQYDLVNDESTLRLQPLLAFLKQQPKINITISAYSNPKIRDPSLAITSSIKRADRVRTVMYLGGVAVRRISISTLPPDPKNASPLLIELNAGQTILKNLETEYLRG